MFQSKDVMATVLNWDIATIVWGTFKFFDLPSNSPNLEEGGQQPHLCQKVLYIIPVTCAKALVTLLSR